AEALRALGADALGLAADVRDAEAIAAALAQAHEAFGDIDVLVSGAAGNFVAPALGMSAKGFRTVVDIDLNGTFNVLRAAHAYLRKPGASVLSISAPQAYNPTPYQAHVCAAKAGVDMLTRVLAMEWGGDGIRVNSIVPGPIGDTEGVRRLAPTPEALARMQASIPLGRFGAVEDIADMARFLSSARAQFVTGAVIPVDGGSSLGGARDLSAAVAA
ncbi:SDR family oxidoreductase, partial [Cupriavidus sp. M-11]